MNEERKKKSSSSKNFVKKEKNILLLYTAISRWITNYRKRNPNTLIEIINKYELNQYEVINVFKKVVFYGLKYPQYVWYVNKYFNNLFEFNKYDSTLILYNIIFLLTQFVDDGNPKYFNKLVMFKSNYKKDMNYNNIIKVISKYFKEVYNIYFNELELKCFYALYENKIIKEIDIYDMNKHLTEPISGLKLELENVEENKKLPTKKEQITEQVSILNDTETNITKSENNKSKSNKNKESKISSFAQKKKKMISEFQIKPENIITEVNENLTLLDIASLDDLVIVEIYVDESGIKKYLIKDYVQPVYFKSGGNWKENTMTTKDVDNVVFISGINKRKASKMIYNNLLELKNKIL